MSKVETKKTDKEHQIFINGLIHLALPKGLSAIHSYIDSTQPSGVDMYYIEFYLASGQTIKAEYDKRELWEEILKGL